MPTPWRLALSTGVDVGSDVLACERDVLFHWYGNTEHDIEAAYGQYLQQTVFLSVTHVATGRVTAFARLITPGVLRVKSLTDIAEPPWSIDVTRCLAAAGIDPSRTWDVATLGARPGSYEGRELAGMAIYNGILSTLKANDARTLVAIVDPRVRRLLAIAGLTCHNLPGAGPATYLGSTDSVPVFAHVAATIDEQRRLNPDAHRLITLGAGLADVAIPRPDDLRVNRLHHGDVIVLPSEDADRVSKD